MSDPKILRQLPDDASQNRGLTEDAEDSHMSASLASDSPPMANSRLVKRLTPFWRDRVMEGSLVLSMLLYYLVGNAHLGTGFLFQLNPIFSLPFLLIFVVLCWYRLSFAVALLPLTLPYYLLQKTVFSHYSFSLAEITLWMCLGVAFCQLLIYQKEWRYWLSWRELRDRLGPFIIPALIYFAAAGISVALAYNRHVALRAFREEIFDPLLYLLLALACLRTRQDLFRLIAALLATGLVVACLGLIQYFAFASQLQPGTDGVRRISSVFSGANDVGAALDYILPVGLALAIVGVRQGLSRSWSLWLRIGAIALCVLLLMALYLSQSAGGGLAIAVATLFILALSIRSRKVLLVSSAILLLALGGTALVFHTQITRLIFEHHVNVRGISTVTKRLYLWESAVRMIRDHPWFGVGMDNWLCYYSVNSLCQIPASIQPFHYWILSDPVTHLSTGIADEPYLAQPHNDILNIWVNTGIFGLLAFFALLALFFWLFSRILSRLRGSENESNPLLRPLTIGIGAAMLAAMTQGMVDSVFLGQDFSFFFLILIFALLMLRELTGTPWRGRLQQKRITETSDAGQSSNAGFVNLHG